MIKFLLSIGSVWLACLMPEGSWMQFLCLFVFIVTICNCELVPAMEEEKEDIQAEDRAKELLEELKAMRPEFKFKHKD
jgi:TRAP-type mannitol/chloroaromatic compound transport system permease large subunit